ncbi:hypothetical protein NW759_006089 [Fusarium solani]|nr:hypothetical protein NW759_006089 [Fusarium solani]
MSRSRSPPMGASLNRDPVTGWGIAFSALGATLLKVGMATAFAVVGAASAVGLAGAAAWVISQALWAWAMSSYFEAVVTAEKILSDRQTEGLDPDRTYVAVCGPSGSGKSSLINALRGLLNNDPDAARVGTTEATIDKQEYQPAACFDRLSLVDFPGAGTQRVPSEGYFTTNKLYCYDTILIICGERFGEIEISLVKACIVHQKRFAIVRSRSDETIKRVKEDMGIPHDEAKRSYIQDEVDAIGAELRRSSLPEENIAELLGFFILVNKNTLRILTMTPPYDWPQQADRKEIHERKLLRFLGKAGVTDEHLVKIPGLKQLSSTTLPIPRDSQLIRVLDIPAKSSTANESLTGSLRIVNLKDSPKFTALSYVWGKASGKSINCNGYEVKVTDSCFEALSSLRKALGSFTIWVNAICINQMDDDEKAAQIPLMGEIYIWAEVAYIWLGPSTVEIKKALDYVKFVSHYRLFPAGIPWNSGNRLMTASQERT